MNLVKPKTVLRRITLAFSLFGTHFFEDPNDLFKKVEQKLRLKGLSFPELEFRTPNGDGELLYEMGEYTKSAIAFESSGIKGKNRARKIRRQLDELQAPIYQSISLDSSVNPQRVLFYLTNSKPFTESGYTERTHHILKALTHNEIQVRGITRLGYPIVVGSFPKNSVSVVDGIEYRRLLPTWFPRTKAQQIDVAVKMLVSEARAFNATILHTTTDFKNAIVVSKAARILGIPWVYETRGELQKTWLSKRPLALQDNAINSEFYLAASKKEHEAMLKAAKIVQLSEVSKSITVKQGISENKITVLPNAVSATELDREFNQGEIRGELGLPDTKLIGAITSVVDYEGLDDLIRALPMLHGVHCVIVGDGESKPALEKLVADLGLESRVIFTGRQPSDSIWKWYASLDVFVLPRKDQEVCRTVTPIKSLLAQANGIPVVASDLPALREVTGNCAMYASPENPEELAHAITETLRRDDKENDFAKIRGKEWVSGRTWDSNARRLASLYQGDI